jgi:small-conductance mechanosensitive channel
MDTFWQDVLAFFSADRVGVIVRAGSTVLVGLVLERLISAGLVRMLTHQADVHQRMLIRRISFYLIAGLFVATAMTDLGFDLSVLLGAAGILTVALGFASQTSASNVISGLFLLGEKAFAVGEIIRIGETTGEVMSIDLLSV